MEEHSIGRALEAGVSLGRVRGEVLSGAEAVLAGLPLLQAEADDWQQADVIGDLHYFVSRPPSYPIAPTLVLLWAEGADRGAAALLGAVLVSHYRGLLAPFHLYLAADRRGRRVVFGPAACRAEIAACAAQALLEHGARFVNLHLNEGKKLVDDEAARAPEHLYHLNTLKLPGLRDLEVEWSLHAHARPFDLELAPTYEATVAKLGPETRRNLKRYSRKCAAELGASYVADAMLTERAFLNLNAKSTHPSPKRLARWRFASLQTFPNTFVAGLREPNGRWLALLGGRRNGGAVEVDWQMNRTGFERYSLSTVLRAGLIAEEVRRGSTSLSMEGGTRHPMVFSFRRYQVYALAVRRPTAALALLAWVLRRYFRRSAPTLALPHASRPWRGCLLNPGIEQE